MPGPSNGGRAGGKGKYTKNNKLLDTLREACPPHKQNELEKLVKTLKGDEEKIRQQIQEWWEEPAGAQLTEGAWEDVNKRSSKKNPRDSQYGGGGGGGGHYGNRNTSGRGGGRNPDGGSRGGRGERGRGGRGRGRGGQRGGAGAGAPGSGQEKTDRSPVETTEELLEQTDAPLMPAGVPHLSSVRAPQGAWAKKTNTESETTAITPPPAFDSTLSTVSAAPPSPIDALTVAPVAAPTAPSPPAPPVSSAPSNDKIVRTAAPTGNVWATKGSAHLIRAEKPTFSAFPSNQVASNAVPAVIAAPASSLLQQQPSPAAVAAISIPQQHSSPAPLPLQSNLPTNSPPPPTSAVPASSSTSSPAPTPPSSAAVAPPLTSTSPTPPDPPTTSAWKQAIAQVPSARPASLQPTAIHAQQTLLDIPSSPVGLSPVMQPLRAPTEKVEQPAPIAPSPPTVAPTISKPPPSLAAPAPPQPRSTPSVLNMGHWESGDADDTNLDFGFGSFGTDNDTGSLDATTTSRSTGNVVSVAANIKEPSSASQAPSSTPSPARPPPGLTIGGMPPMPSNAVLVHELEGQLESTSLQPPKASLPVPIIDKQMHPTSYNSSIVDTGSISHIPHSQQTYNQYGMGMYNYNATAPGNGFVGVTGTAGPVLSAGVVPQQQQQPKLDPTTVSSMQSGLYGAPHSISSASSSGPSLTGGTGVTTAGPANESNPSAGGIPPGMPNMPYGNPAMYYGQQPFHMSQHQGGIGYNYGYGAQFGGAVQGSFGYPQAMGQSGGYPHYDDQGAQGGGGAGYQKNSGGYRGRNAQHNQYQTQYNPQQHGGYSGQPYGLGYHNDHFNQRGAYGGMQDPYAMQQQQQQQPLQQQQQTHQQGSFQDDQYNKGKKGRGGLPQFQPQGPPQQLNSPQSFGLQAAQGGVGVNSASQQTGGWSNHQQSSAPGGWSGGGPSWQGK